MKYELKQNTKMKHVSLVLLNEIINFQNYFPVSLTGEDIFLTEYLNHLNMQGLVTMKDGKYIPTDRGRTELENFYKKYYDYLKMFDIYCAVDLDKGEFAFEKIFSDFNEQEWHEYLAEERFSDVRVAVAEFKGLDAVEIVFMSFLNEGRFDLSQPRWQYHLTGDGVWNEIIEICKTAISSDYLKENDVIQDLVKQGSKLAIELLKQEQELEPEQDVEEVIEETTTEEYVDIVEMPYYGYDYFDPYYDPFYISPIWLVPCLLF